MADLQRESLDRMVGTRERGQDVHLTGSEQPIPEALGIHDRAFITVESQSVRYRFDGGDPTATANSGTG